MAAQIGALYVQLLLNSGPYAAGFANAQRVTSRAVAGINRDVGLAQRTVNTFTGSAANRNFRPYAIIAASRAYETAADRSNLLRGSLIALTAVAGGFTAALGTNLLSRYADTAINLANQLRTVTDSTSNLLAVQDALADVAQRSRSSLQATVTLYARTARATESLGYSQENLLRITETVQKAFAIGGATSAEAQGAAIQLAQGIASDRFSGEEFRSVAENAPVLLRGMAEALGVNIGRLREMAHAGELTAEVVTKAILKSSDRIEREFGETIISLDRALAQVDNQILEFIGNTDKAYGITALLSSGITAFGDNLESIIPPLTTVAALVGAVFLARNRGAVGSGLGAIVGGGIGFGLGGLEGAIAGAALGGFGGFAASRKDGDGLGFIARIKRDAADARANVVQLTDAQRALKAELLQSSLAANKARRDAEGNLARFAPNSLQSAMSREQLQIQKLDEQKLAVLRAQRAAYDDLGAVQSRITPRAAKLADTQVRAEAKLAEHLGQRANLADRVVKATTLETLALGKQTVTGVRAAAAVKARAEAQKAVAANEAAIARTRSQVEERALRISQLASEADRRAAAERIAIGRQIYAQYDAINKLDEQRVAQTHSLAAARRAAEQAGAGIARENVAQTAQQFRAVSQALKDTTAQLGAATRAASPLGQAMGVVRTQATSLMNLFGGPWGVAIAGAALIFASFALDAQRRAQSIANAKRLIDEVLGDEPAGAGQGAGSLLSREIEKIEESIRTIEGGAGEAQRALERIFDPLNTVEEAGLGQTAQHIANIVNSIRSLPVAGKIDELEALTTSFVNSDITVGAFRTRLEELRLEADNDYFNEIAAQVLAYANTVAGAGPAVDGLKQKIIDLQEAANDPITLLITSSFAALDGQPINPALEGELGQFVTGQNFTTGLEDELEILRLTGDARKRAQYTADALAQAEKDGVDVTREAIRQKINAYVEERIALEARDAAFKQSEKVDPFERAQQNLRERLALQQAENNAISLGTYEVERAKAAQELLNAAKEAGMEIGPDVLATIDQEAAAYAAVAAAQEKLAEQRKAQAEDIEFYKSAFSSFFIDIKNGLLEGASAWEVFANAAYNALNKIADRALGLAADGIFDMIFGAIAGGLTGGIGGGLWNIPTSFVPGGFYPGFAGGGAVLGRGSGTSDSNLAMLSRGEYVINAAATRRNLPLLEAINDNRVGAFANGGLVTGYSGNVVPFAPRSLSGESAAPVSITYAPQIDARNSRMTAAELDAVMIRAEKRFEAKLPAMLQEARRRGGM